MIRAGKLDRVIEIQRATETIDAAGVPSPSWSTVATVRAELVDLSTEEMIRASGASTETALVFRTWWRDGIELADRVLFDGDAFNIRGVKEIGRRRLLEIRAERIGL